VCAHADSANNFGVYAEEVNFVEVVYGLNEELRKRT
jgi:hypothetical protein